jgi:CheY-like chemotaxis protein
MSEVTDQLVRRRILLVEDEYLIAEIMEDWLRQAGADVLGPVPNVEQALEIIGAEATAPDGAILDVNLGYGETSYPVADRLNELGVPYLFATGDVRIIDHPAHRDRPHLDKPTSQRDLLRAVVKLLAVEPRSIPEGSMQAVGDG